MGILKGENKEGGERERWQQKQRRFRTEEDEDRKGERGFGKRLRYEHQPMAGCPLPAAVFTGGGWWGLGRRRSGVSEWATRLICAQVQRAESEWPKSTSSRAKSCSGPDESRNEAQIRPDEELRC
jgi:hypothetical protein